MVNTHTLMVNEHTLMAKIQSECYIDLKNIHCSVKVAKCLNSACIEIASHPDVNMFRPTALG